MSAEVGHVRHAPDLAAERRARIDALCLEGWRLWERFDSNAVERDFHSFVAADYDAVRIALEACCRPGLRFLELGSATGVITVMANLLGCDAYGIELDASLVDTARRLAVQFDSDARFAAGSFVPTGYRRTPDEAPDGSDTIGTGPSGYLKLGRALDEFDVVFAYPWHGDEPFMLDLMRVYGRSNALLLLNHTNDGVRAYRAGRERALQARESI